MGLQQFDTLGRWLVNDIGWVSVEILALTGIVYALTKWGRVRSSRTRRWLWTLAVVKPLVTLLVAWPLTLGGGSHDHIAPLQEPTPSDAVNVLALDEAVTPADFLAGATSGLPAPTQRSEGAAQREHHPTPVTVKVAGGGAITGFAVLGAIWALGTLGLGLYTLLGVGWLLHVRRSAVLIAGDDLIAACEQYPEAVAKLTERVEVRLTTRISEPCIYGLFRPAILLPTWCLEDNTPPNLEYILLHEGMHYRARDHWFLGLRRVMEVFLWFHPAVWYAGHKAMIEAENVCDEAVVNLAYRHGTASAALMYSSCLMRVLERATRHAFEALVPGVIPTAERIRRLVQQDGPFANSVSVVSIVAVAALAIVSLPGAGGPSVSLVERGYEAVTREDAPVREVLFSTKYPGDYHFNLYAARSDGTGVRRLTDDRAYYEEASWAPDGSRIAAFSWQPGTGGWTTYIHDANGKVLHSLCGPGWGPRGATWSPDSKYIIATGRRMPRQGGNDSVYNLYRFDASKWDIHRLTDDTVERRDAAWSPDGRTVAYLRARDGAPGYDLALMNPDGTGEQVIHHDEPEGVFQSRPAWSPDSARLAYFVHGATLDQPHELRIMDVASRQSTVVGLMPGKLGQRRQAVAWLPGHNALVVTDVRKGNALRCLYRVSLETGKMTRISSPFADARFPSAGPLADPLAETTRVLTAPAVVGPVRHPHTGHVYYAVMAARSVTGDAAQAAAEKMEFEGAYGYLTAITTDEEGEFLLSRFPFAHHGFWLGGRGARVQPDASLASRPWTWPTGEEWDYTSWLNGEPNREAMIATWRTMTDSNTASEPERGRSQTRLMWAGRSTGSHELGFIVEFDAPPEPVSQSASPDATNG